MAEDKILDKILCDAKAEAAALVAQGEEKARAAVQALEREYRMKASSIESATQAQCSQIEKGGELLANLEARKASLKYKREVIDSAFDIAVKALCLISDDQYEALIVKNVVRVVETGREVLLVSEKDKPRYAGGMLGKLDASLNTGVAPVGYNLLAKLNEAVKDKGLPPKLTLCEECAKIQGGVIVISDISQIDLSFEALVQDVRRDCEKEVSKLLFGEV